MTDAELLEAVTYAICRDAPTTGWHVLAAERAIAAIRASGRLAPEAPKDMLRGAAEVIGCALLAPAKLRDGKVDPIGALVPAAEAGAAYLAPLIAAATEAKVREECAKIADGWAYLHYQEGQKSVAGDAYAEGAAEQACYAIAAAIRTGSAS